MGCEHCRKGYIPEMDEQPRLQKSEEELVGSLWTLAINNITINMKLLEDLQFSQIKGIPEPTVFAYLTSQLQELGEKLCQKSDEYWSNVHETTTE